MKVSRVSSNNEDKDNVKLTSQKEDNFVNDVWTKSASGVTGADDNLVIDSFTSSGIVGNSDDFADVAAPDLILPESDNKSEENPFRAIEYPRVDPTDVINELKSVNDIKYANRKGIKIGEKWYDFDSNGRAVKIYNAEPEDRPGHDSNADIYGIKYGETGEMESYYRYLNNGNMNEEGKRVSVRYDNNGYPVSFVEESDINEFGQVCTIKEYFDADKVLSFVSNYEYETDNNGTIQKLAITYEPSFGSIVKVVETKNDDSSEHEITMVNGIIIKYKTGSPISKNKEDIKNVNKSDITFIKDGREFNIQSMTPNDFYDLLDMLPQINKFYKEVPGHYLLADLATNPTYGKEMIEIYVSEVLKGAEDINALAGDIYRDMDENYKNENWARLNIDCERLTARAESTAIMDEYNGRSNNVPFNSVDSNLFDIPTRQGYIGTCYLLSSTYTATQKPLANDLLKQSVIPNDEEKVITVKFPGVNKTYNVSYEDLDNLDVYSNGDFSVRAFEIAFDWYRRDKAYECADNGVITEQVDANGGFLSDFTVAMFGIKAEDHLDPKTINPGEYNDETKMFDFALIFDDNDNEADIMGNYSTGTIDNPAANVPIKQAHEFSILGYTNGMVLFKDPQEDITRVISLEKFNRIAEVSRFDLGQLEKNSS